MNKLSLHWKIIIGIILGVVWAVSSSFLGWSEFTIKWISPFGDIFINLLKLIAIPLVLFSVIKGISGISNISLLGKMGFKTLFIYLLTTILSVSIGLTLVNLIKPGEKIALSQRESNHISYQSWATDKQYVTDDVFLDDKMKFAENQKNNSPLQFVVDMVPSNIFFSLTKNKLMLQIIFFAIFFWNYYYYDSKKTFFTTYLYCKCV